MESSVLRDQIQAQVREGRLAPEDLGALAETIRLRQAEEPRYADVSVVIDGAVEDVVTLYGEVPLDELCGEVEEAAKIHRLPTEVYVVWHLHEMSDCIDECGCVQYEQTHHPFVSFNQEVPR